MVPLFTIFTSPVFSATKIRPSGRKAAEVVRVKPLVTTSWLNVSGAAATTDIPKLTDRKRRIAFIIDTKEILFDIVSILNF